MKIFNFADNMLFLPGEKEEEDSPSPPVLPFRFGREGGGRSEKVFL